MLDLPRLGRLTAVLQAVTGIPFVAREKRLTADSAWVVWDADVHVRYVLSVAPAGWRTFAVSLGVQRGTGTVETRLEASLSTAQVERLLRDPHELVGILVGQRRYVG